MTSQFHGQETFRGQEVWLLAFYQQGGGANCSFVHEYTDTKLVHNLVSQAALAKAT